MVIFNSYVSLPEGIYNVIDDIDTYICRTYNVIDEVKFIDIYLLLFYYCKCDVRKMLVDWRVSINNPSKTWFGTESLHLKTPDGRVIEMIWVLIGLVRPSSYIYTSYKTI